MCIRDSLYAEGTGSCLQVPVIAPQFNESSDTLTAVLSLIHILRIDGVRDGKPAALAGMMKGDVIMKLGGKDIKDIYVYMEALSAFHKGDKTTLVALRDGKEVEFTIQFRCV